MRLIVAVDDNNGMMFNNRRQSQDAVLREEIMRMVKRDRAELWMNRDSLSQFLQEDSTHIRVDEDFLSKAGLADYCFLEDMRLFHHQDTLMQVAIVRWNRQYPADVYFDTALLQGMKLVRMKEFRGNSHPKITMEVYM